MRTRALNERWRKPWIATASSYRKNGEFRATRVSVATPVETVLADGRKETRNVASPGDFVVTGPGGERYVVKPEVFAARYERKRGARDVYFAHGEIIAVPNPLGRAIRFRASWGEVQTGAPDCMIADMFDPATRKRAGQPLYYWPRGIRENLSSRQTSIPHALLT